MPPQLHLKKTKIKSRVGNKLQVFLKQESERRAAYSKSLPSLVGGAASLSRLSQRGRHLFIVKSQRWEQLVDIYCGDLRAVYQKASAGETQSTWSSGEIYFFLSETEGGGLRPSPSRQLSWRCRVLKLHWGFFVFILTSEHGSVMLTFDP